MNHPRYAELLLEEAEVWNRAAETQARETEPDWHSLRQLRHNWAFHRQHIDDLLEEIKPGMRVLELGCGSGFLTLAAARRGAFALGIDIADQAIEIARSYYDEHEGEFPGTAAFQVADLNQLALPEERFDVILAKGVLHHLPRADLLIEQVDRALKPGGLFWISDTYAPVSARTAFAAGLFALVLPVHMPYRKKLKALFHFGGRSVERVQASMQAEGLSPFEGAGTESHWLERVHRVSTVTKRMEHPAIAGYLASQISAPDWLAIPVLRWICALDALLVRLHLIESCAATLYAYKAGAGDSTS